MVMTQPAKRWIWVSLPYATFGIAVSAGVVVEAAPIARWTLGRDEREVAGYFRRRGAEMWPEEMWPQWYLSPHRSEGHVPAPAVTRLASQ
jgi:hypothetical protein